MRDFIWTDELVEELLHYSDTHTRGILSYIGNGYNELLEKFKQSKQPKNNFFKVDENFNIIETEFYHYSHTFTTKEKAEEFILFNKPCLSVNDIRKLLLPLSEKELNLSHSYDFYFKETLNHPLYQKLKELSKQKLNIQ